MLGARAFCAVKSLSIFLNDTKISATSTDTHFPLSFGFHKHMPNISGREQCHRHRRACLRISSDLLWPWREQVMLFGRHWWQLKCVSPPRAPPISIVRTTNSNGLGEVTMKIPVVSLLALVGTASSFVVNHNKNALLLRETRLYERKPFITGNWKLNPNTREEAVELAKGIADSITDDSPCDVALFVPFPFIEAAQNAAGDKLTVGAEVRNQQQI